MFGSTGYTSWDARGEVMTRCVNLGDVSTQVMFQVLRLHGITKIRAQETLAKY